MSPHAYSRTGDTARVGRKKLKTKNSVPATSIRKRRCQQLPALRLPGVPLLNNIFTLTLIGGQQVWLSGGRGFASMLEAVFNLYHHTYKSFNLKN